MGRTITACVFDMDGVLIDTEPVWRETEHDVFARVGVELTDAQLRETWGMRIEEVVDYRYRVRPWNGIRPRAVEREIIREMVAYAHAVCRARGLTGGRERRDRRRDALHRLALGGRAGR